MIMDATKVAIPFPTPAKPYNKKEPYSFISSEYFTMVSCKFSQANCQNSTMGFAMVGQFAVLPPGGGIKGWPESNNSRK